MAESRLHCVGVPAVRARRDELLDAARERVRREELIPPLTLSELRETANRLCREAGLDRTHRDYLMVLLNNALWEDSVAAIPFDRRVLLLPQCLRDRDRCPAELDEFGLLCEQCGRCPTGDLLREAEELGYVVLVAEGTTVVTTLLETGQVDCVIGVSCLSTLERSFPYSVSAAIPALALPLISDGCDRTQLDLDWVRAAIGLKSAEEWKERPALKTVRKEVDSWFTSQSVRELLDAHGTQAEALAAQWTTTGGKRWRPFLATCVQRVLDESQSTECMKRIAVAVESFHKASLVHDDIEDDEDVRYEVPTLHRQYGVPIALNVGDLLIGEGYRLIAESGLGAERQARMLRVAALGHRELCLGQGDELAWTRDPGPLPRKAVLEIFRRKTAPAFEVALSLGAIAGGADEEVCAVLADVSRALGIAYQIRDDIEDFEGEDLDAMRPSMLVALALERIEAGSKRRLESELERGRWNGGAALLRRTVAAHDLIGEAWRLYGDYRDQALAALRPLRHQALKSLLFQLIHKILTEAPKEPQAESRQGTRTRARSLPVVAAAQEVSNDAAV